MGILMDGCSEKTKPIQSQIKNGLNVIVKFLRILAEKLKFLQQFAIIRQT